MQEAVDSRLPMLKFKWEKLELQNNERVLLIKMNRFQQQVELQQLLQLLKLEIIELQLQREAQQLHLNPNSSNNKSPDGAQNKMYNKNDLKKMMYIHMNSLIKMQIFQWIQKRIEVRN